MPSTTIKVSTDTRDRIRAHGGATYEETIVAALDALEADRFWGQAEAAAAWRASLAPDEQQKLIDAEAEVDRAFDGVE